MGPSQRTELDDLKAMKSHPDTHYRTKELERRINDKFNEIYGAYNSGKTGDENSDLELFAKKNVEWKQFCYRISRTQKLVTPNVFAFQNKVAKDQGKPEPVTVEIKEGEKKLDEKKI